MSDQAHQAPAVPVDNAPPVAVAEGENPASPAGKPQTAFSSMNELQEKYPQLYKMMMDNSMMAFIQKQNNFHKRIHELNRESYRH